jgi:hypothetical protein
VSHALRWLDCACNALRDLVLNGEDIGEVSVIPLRPDVRSGGCVNQLRRDADPVRRFPHAAFEHITYAQLAAHLLYVDGATFVSEGRVPGDDEEPTHPRQRRDDVIHDPVGEILLLGIAAHVLEWQHCDRRLIRQRQGRPGLREATIQPQAIYVYRPTNILELLLAGILEIYVQSIADLVIRGIRNADSTGLRYPLQPSRHIYTIAEQVLTLDHHIAEVDAYTELDPPLGREIGISAVHLALHIKGTPNRVHHGGKLDENAVACGFHNPAAMQRNGGINQLAPKLAQALERALFVNTGQPGIARHIGGQDGCKLPGRAHDLSEPA